MASEQRKHPVVAPSCVRRGAGFLVGEADPAALCRAAERVVAEGGVTRAGGGGGAWTLVGAAGEFPTVAFDPLLGVRSRCLEVPVVEVVGPTSWGQRVAEVAPGPELAALVAGRDPAGVATQDMVEIVAAVDRLASWVHYQRARWARELADRPEMHPWRTPGVRPQDGCVAADELAMRLGTSRNATSTMVSEGDAFASVLYQTGQALQAGTITPAKARVLTRRLPDLPVLVAQEVEDVVLPTAATRTVSQLGRDVEKALVRVDAEGAADRGERARAGRRVCRPRVLPDGMASMYVELPAPDAMRVDGVLESTARALRAAGDGRTLDQARADTLCDLVLDRPLFTAEHLATLAETVGTATPAALDRAGRCTGSGNRGEGAAALGGTTVGDGIAVGTGAEVRDGVAVASGGEVAGGGGGAKGRAGAGFGCAPVLGDSCAAPGTPLGAVEGVTAARCPRPHATAAIQVTVALTTLVGLDEQPAELDGYGPIGADQAREIAHGAGSTWRRIVTDPLSGAVLDVGRSRYTPPAPLAAHVRARDRRCAAPGCDVPAIRCDIDHTLEFYGVPNGPPAPRGTTSSCNLGPLCARHHRLKTDRGFVLRQNQPGVFTWTTPAGHRYRTRPGTDTGYEHLDQHGQPWPHPPTPDDQSCANDPGDGDGDSDGDCGSGDGDRAGDRGSDGSDSGVCGGGDDNNGSSDGLCDRGEGSNGAGDGVSDGSNGGGGTRDGSDSSDPAGGGVGDSAAGTSGSHGPDGEVGRPSPTEDDEEPDAQRGRGDRRSQTAEATQAAVNRILPGLFPLDPTRFDREPPF